MNEPWSPTDPGSAYRVGHKVGFLQGAEEASAALNKLAEDYFVGRVDNDLISHVEAVRAITAVKDRYDSESQGR